VRDAARDVRLTLSSELKTTVTVVIPTCARCCAGRAPYTVFRVEDNSNSSNTDLCAMLRGTCALLLSSELKTTVTVTVTAPFLGPRHFHKTAGKDVENRVGTLPGN
jgi:hypothetical protein